MIRRTPSRRPRRLVFGVVALALAASAVAGAFVGSADANLQHVETTYYSDASMIRPVGFEIRPCTGGSQLFGRRSPFQETITESCP